MQRDEEHLSGVSPTSTSTNNNVQSQKVDHEFNTVVGNNEAFLPTGKPNFASGFRRKIVSRPGNNSNKSRTVIGLVMDDVNTRAEDGNVVVDKNDNLDLTVLSDSDDDLDIESTTREVIRSAKRRSSLKLVELYGPVFSMISKLTLADDSAHAENSEKKEAYDHSGRTSYIEACKKSGVVPASYYLRHMHDNVLEMKHHGLGASGTKPICVSLVSNTHVQNLNLSDNWLGPVGGISVSDMLKENCFITHLDLTDNRLGNSFAASIVEVLQMNTTLTTLILAGNEFDDKAALYFADAILNTSKIDHLNLSHNHFGEASGIALGPAIAENASIKHLDLSWNHIRRRGAVAVAQGVKNNICLKYVNLSWNGFALDGANAIGDALKVNAVLECLDISNNRINPEGAVNIGKGVSINENLQELKMGKNPIQTAGCYGICAAILKNPNCVIQNLDFSDILVNPDFYEIFKQVMEQLPQLKCVHGSDSVPQKPKFRIHPMIKLKNYIEKQNLRLVDVFNKWDKDQSMSVTREEFIAGVEDTGIKLTREEIEQMVDELDKDGDGEINYNELVMGHASSMEKEMQLQQPIRAYKPSSAPPTRSGSLGKVI